MSNQTERKWMIRFVFWAKKYAKNNPIVSISFLSGIVGGGTLFWYYLLLGQMPDFTLPQTTGIFSAAFLAGIIVIGTFALTCVAPAAVARYALDEMLPENPTPSYFWIPAEAKAEPAAKVTAQMRAELLNRAFPVELSALSILAWGGIGLTPLADFFWPSDPGLVIAIYAVMVFTLLLLVLMGSQLRSEHRIALRILVAFGFSVIGTLFILHKAGLDAAAPLLSFSFPSGLIPDTSGPSISRQFLRTHVYVLAATLATLATGLLAYAAMLGERRRLQRNAISGPLRPKVPPSMFTTRFWLALVYVAFSSFPLMLALEFAQLNGPAHAIRSLGTIILYLALFNLAFFSMASMKRNFFKASLIAIGFFVVTVMVPMQRPTVIPKGVVFALGLGYFHSSTILLSSLQCPRLAIYGIECEAKKDDAIVVTNVNVLNRMGSTATLELQIRREGSDIDKSLTIAGLALSADLPEPASTHNPKPVLLTREQSVRDFANGDPQQPIIAARQCDDSIASWLRSPWEAEKSRLANRNKYVRLWCVTVNVPADQLLDFDKDGTRSYKGGYSEFIGRQPATKT
jgi:hypothetical protein